MTTLRYTFRPSLFQSERTVVADDQSVSVEPVNGPKRRFAWAEVEEVHIEPATAGDDGERRWLLNLRLRGGEHITVDSVNVRGTADFEHKTKEWQALVGFVHRRLAGRQPPARFRYGTRSGVIVAWRIALVMVIAAGIFGMVAAIATEEFEAIFYAGPFAAFGVVGLLMLKGARGPTTYDPVAFSKAWDEPSA